MGPIMKSAAQGYTSHLTSSTGAGSTLIAYLTITATLYDGKLLPVESSLPVFAPIVFDCLDFSQTA